MDKVSTAINILVNNAMNDSRTAAVTLGVGTVIATHTFAIILPPKESGAPAWFNHSAINLAAAAAIVYGSRLLG